MGAAPLHATTHVQSYDGTDNVVAAQYKRVSAVQTSEPDPKFNSYRQWFKTNTSLGHGHMLGTLKSGPLAIPGTTNTCQ